MGTPPSTTWKRLDTARPILGSILGVTYGSWATVDARALAPATAALKGVLAWISSSAPADVNCTSTLEHPYGMKKFNLTYFFVFCSTGQADSRQRQLHCLVKPRIQR